MLKEVHLLIASSVKFQIYIALHEMNGTLFHAIFRYMFLIETVVYMVPSSETFL